MDIVVQKLEYDKVISSSKTYYYYSLISQSGSKEKNKTRKGFVLGLVLEGDLY